METMSFETSAASDGLYLAFPGGLLSSSDVWLGSGWLHFVDIGPGATAPVAAATLKVYDALDYSTFRPIVNATTLARYCVRPGGTLAATRDTNGSPYSKVATLTMTGLRPIMQMVVDFTLSKFNAIMLVDKPCPSGIIVALTTDATETGTFMCNINFTPGITGSTRKRNAAQLTAQPIALM